MYKKELETLMDMALKIDCVPVGAVVIKKGKIVGRGYNRKNYSNKITDHAEIIAINEACNSLGDWRLNDCDLYVTMYPCLMCLGAIKESRIQNVYYYIDRVKNKTIVNDNILTNVNFVKLKESDFVDKRMADFFKNKRKNN